MILITLSKVIEKLNFGRTSTCLGDGNNLLSQKLLHPYSSATSLRKRRNIFNKRFSLSQYQLKEQFGFFKAR